MKIIEKDLFNYVFYPENLTLEKYNLILNNRENFVSELTLLKEIKKNLRQKVSPKITERILAKIHAETKKPTIVLERIDNPHLFESDHLVLAAECPKLERKFRTDTYQDIDSKYLVKVITDEIQNKVFIFNKDNTEMRNIEITIEPSCKTFLVESSFSPFVILPREEISNISILLKN